MICRTASRWTMVLALLVGIAAASRPVGAAVGPAQETHPPIQAEPEATAADEAGAPGQGPQEGPAFKNWKEKLSYSLGVDLASNLRWQRIDVDVDVLVRALRDTLAGNKLLMTGEEVIATLQRFEAERKQDFEHARAMRSERNKREGEAFVAENVKKEGVVTLPSGLQYKILKQGDGKKPTLDDKVVVQYRGTLLDGTEFDSSYKGKQPVSLPVKGLIRGWSEALQLMPAGSKWQLFIPPQLAYGERVVGGVGPNAMLIFEVELLSVVDTVGKGAQPDASHAKVSQSGAETRPASR